MESTAVATSTDDERTLEWRRENLRLILRRSMSATAAEPLVAAAAARGVDYHELERMLDRGCPLHLALEILR